MYDTIRQVELVKGRYGKNTRRRQKASVDGLAAVLYAVVCGTDADSGQGCRAGPDRCLGGGFGAMLLREDAGGYVLVGVAAFAAAVVLTVFCMRLHERRKAKNKRRTQHEKVSIPAFEPLPAAGCAAHAGAGLPGTFFRPRDGKNRHKLEDGSLSAKQYIYVTFRTRFWEVFLHYGCSRCEVR